MNIRQKKALYESIMKNVAKQVKKTLNEIGPEFTSTTTYDIDYHELPEKPGKLNDSQITQDDIDNMKLYVKAKCKKIKPITIQEVYDSPEYDLCGTEYICIEDPSFFDIDNPDAQMAFEDWLFEEISDEYAEEDLDAMNISLDKIARQLSKTYPNVLFCIERNYCEHGNIDDLCTGEVNGGYINGIDMTHLVN